jgi:serine/threonine protein kinase
METSVEHLIEGISRSGLMSDGEVRAFRDSVVSDSRPLNADSLVGHLVSHGKLTQFQAGMIRAGDLEGLVLGDYVLIDRIGEGGMGQVMKARHRTMDRDVAIKLLPPEATASPREVERFHQEIRAAAKLDHPHIVMAHDAGRSGHYYYLVMKFVEGSDLSAVVATRGPLPVAEAVGAVTQAARGLQYAHDAGIVHRDVKPSNLVLDRQGVVRVVDFGLARLNTPPADPVTGETASHPVTRPGQIMGTYDYMPPEQARNTSKADERCDIYSLGCTLYFLLAGKSPYGGATPSDKIVAHCMEPIPSARESRKDVPVALDAVMKKMMAKKPEDRYQSMAEVIKALKTVDSKFHLGAVSDVTSPGDSSLSTIASQADAARGQRSQLSVRTQQPSHAGRTGKWWLLAAAGAAIALGSAAGYWVWNRGTPGGADNGPVTQRDLPDDTLRDPPGDPPRDVPPKRHVPSAGTTEQGGANPEQSGSTKTLGTGLIKGEPVPAVPDFPVQGAQGFGTFTDDLWDIANGVKVTANSPLGSHADVPHDIRCLFGHERGGKDGQLSLFERAKPGFVHFVEWETPEPITLRSFFMKASHDGERTRSFRRFTLLAADPETGRFDIKLFEIEPAIPYGQTPLPGTAFRARQGPAVLAFRANVTPVNTNRFRAEFEQNEDDDPLPLGPKVMELDGFDEFFR